MGLNPQACDHDKVIESSQILLPELGKVYEAQHNFHLLPSYDQQFNEPYAAPEEALKSSQKRLLVFDQSGNQTCLLQSRFPFNKEHANPEKLLLHEDDVNGKEESEMHEDTEEINALLYSDDEDNDDWDSDSDDDDEVKSTGHSPCIVEQQACNKTTKEIDVTEISSDDGPFRKRQKLQDHSYISSKQETGSGLSDEQSRKDKIQTGLRILESVVPGAKGKEALLLLDEAIDYLKLLKRDLNHW